MAVGRAMHTAMHTLALKIAITPALILAATLAGRRWGEAIGGWLVGLPLTSGPVVYFLAIERGTGFAAEASRGSIAGIMAQVAFGLAYCAAAGCGGWPFCVAAGSVAFGLCAGALQGADLALAPVFLLAMASLVAARRLLPAPATPLAAPGPSGRADLPARMIAATAIVVAITTAAPVLGAQLSGLLATFPVFASVLAIFAHRSRGPAGARQVFDGLFAGLFAFGGFFLVLSLSIESLGIAAAFIAATLAALLIQAASWAGLRRKWITA